MKVMRDLVGATLSSRYRLVARLAGGGMGEVYRAHDLLLDRTVAVKVLQPSLAVDPQLVARFREEARAAARLNHPNIVSVHDWGAEDDSTYYMVMEYVSGVDMRDVMLAHATLEPRHAAEVTVAVCEALEAAHSAGLVHRDVKPENILIARDGSVKVVDFGIAIVADVDLTQPGGNIPGTLRYLSPEQAGGGPATWASDLWAAGAVLGEMLSGAAPSRGAGVELLQRRASEPPAPPSVFNASVPPSLDAIVLRACALDPSERFASARDMADAVQVALYDLEPAPPLASLLEEETGEIHLSDAHPTVFQPGRKRRRGKWRRRWMALIAAIVVALAGGLALKLTAGPELVETPDLVGLTRTRAALRADELGLAFKVSDRASSLTVPRGEVLAQFPSDGDLEAGSEIRAVVSSGLPSMRVVDVRGLPLEHAATRLRSHGFEIEESEREYSLEPEGTVLRQEPADGKLRWGSSVALVVSRGPQPITTPDVVGMSYSKAAQEIRDAGLEPARDEEYSDDVPEGTVISMEPGAGTSVSQGDPVVLIVSLGPEFKKVEVPDLRNMHVDDARARLTTLGLRPRVVQSCPGSTVYETDPVAGTIVRENDVVALFVC